MQEPRPGRVVEAVQHEVRVNRRQIDGLYVILDLHMHTPVTARATPYQTALNDPFVATTIKTLIYTNCCAASTAGTKPSKGPGCWNLA